MNLNRRNLLWSVPVVSVVAASPAFATSTQDPTPDLAPVGCKQPGYGKNCKDYYVRTKHRDDVVVLTVLIGGREALPISDHGWEVQGFSDSRAKRDVVITYTLASNPGKNLQWSGEVFFPPCKDY